MLRPLELGPNWTVLGETAQVGSLPTANLANLPTEFVNTVIGTGSPTPTTIVVTKDRHIWSIVV